MSIGLQQGSTTLGQNDERPVAAKSRDGLDEPRLAQVVEIAASRIEWPVLAVAGERSAKSKREPSTLRPRQAGERL
jgi:hypothetical protein